MPQITEANGLLAIVDRAIHNFGEAGPKDVISFEFDYKGSESSIEYIETNCPCIKAWYTPGKLQGTLDLSKVLKQAYAPGSTNVGKTFNVFINDGVNRFTSNNEKQKLLHPLKRWFSLLVTGNVVV